jgi:hypothetical protein
MMRHRRLFIFAFGCLISIATYLIASHGIDFIRLIYDDPRLAYTDWPLWLRIANDAALYLCVFVFVIALMSHALTSFRIPIGFLVGGFFTPIVLSFFSSIAMKFGSNEYLEPRKFDQKVWFLSDDTNDFVPRVAMARDLLYIVGGKRTEEIVGLIGAPDIENLWGRWDMAYRLHKVPYYRPGRSLWLAIALRSNGTAIPDIVWK